MTRNKAPRHEAEEEHEGQQPGKGKLLPIDEKPQQRERPAGAHQDAGTLRHLDRSGAGEADEWFIGTWLLVQIGPQFLRHVVHGSQPAQLQGPQIGDDGPAILHRDIRPVSPHEVAAVA